MTLPSPSVPSSDLDVRFQEVLAQRGAARKRFSMELWHDLMRAGCHASLDRLVDLHKRHADVWAPSSSKRLVSALTDPSPAAIQWCLSRQEFGWGPARPLALTSMEKVELGNAVSHGLAWAIPGESITLPALLIVLNACPDVLTAIRVDATARASTILDEALASPDDLATLLLAFAQASPGPGQPGNVVDAWLRRHAQKDTSAQAQQLAQAVEQTPRLAHALSAHFPLHLPGFDLTVPQNTHLPIRKITPLRANSLEQLYGWVGGRGMEWAFSRPPSNHSAHVVCQDPELFGSWLGRVAQSPAIVARLLSRDKDLAQAVRAWRSEQGGTALDVLIAPRLFMTVHGVGAVPLPWTRLERWFDRKAPELFAIPRADGQTFNDLLAEHFPRWHSMRRRAALDGIVPSSTKRPAQARPTRL